MVKFSTCYVSQAPPGLIASSERKHQDTMCRILKFAVYGIRYTCFPGRHVLPEGIYRIPFGATSFRMPKSPFNSFTCPRWCMQLCTVACYLYIGMNNGVTTYTSHGRDCHKLFGWLAQPKSKGGFQMSVGTQPADEDVCQDYYSRKRTHAS